MGCCATGARCLSIVFSMLLVVSAAARPGLANEEKRIYNPSRSNYSFGERLTVLREKGRDRVEAHGGLWKSFRLLGLRRGARTALRGLQLTSSKKHVKGAAQLFELASQLDLENHNQIIRSHGEGQAHRAVTQGNKLAQTSFRLLTFWEAFAQIAPKFVTLDVSALRNTLYTLHDKLQLPAINPAVVDMALPLAVAGMAIGCGVQAVRTFHRAGRHELLGIAEFLNQTGELVKLMQQTDDGKKVAPDAPAAVLKAIAKERKRVKRTMSVRKWIPGITSDTVVKIRPRREWASEWLASLDKLEADIKSLQKDHQK